MSDRRQGRPCRGGAEVGKEKILQALRDLLRSQQCYDLSRKAVAAYAGVTPALVSYYFPQKLQLLEEAVTPIMQTYFDEIDAIVSANKGEEDKRKSVISVLMRLYKHDGRLFDVYRDVVERSQSASDQIAKMTSAFADLFNVPADRRSEDNVDAVILHGAIWGMCRFAAQIKQELWSEEPAGRFDRLRGEFAETVVARVLRTLSGDVVALAAQ